MTKWILLFVIGIMFESTGLVFLKKGMITVPEVRPLTVSKAFSVVKTAATNGQILLGVFCQAVFFACLLILMTQADISFLWPLTGLGFVVAAVAGAIFLHEHVSSVRWAGVILSMIGAALISSSGHPKSTGEAASQAVSQLQHRQP
ncbi:MAG: EamA family transporter [Verrucomicrobiia bacterium]